MASRRSRRGSGVPGGCDVGRERAQTGGSDRLYEGARVRLDGVDGFRVVRDRCLFFLSPYWSLGAEAAIMTLPNKTLEPESAAAARAAQGHRR